MKDAFCIMEINTRCRCRHLPAPAALSSVGWVKESFETAKASMRDERDRPVNDIYDTHENPIRMATAREIA